MSSYLGGQYNLGGQFEPLKGGHIVLAEGGQFTPVLGGQFAWIFQKTPKTTI